MLRCEAQAWIDKKRKVLDAGVDEFIRRVDNAETLAVLNESVQATYTNELLEQILLAVSEK